MRNMKNEPVVYIVKRAFKYLDGVDYKPRDIFEPTGARNDRVIIEFYCKKERPPKAQRRQKGGKNGTRHKARPDTAGTTDD
jgi:hypothetical protein